MIDDLHTIECLCGKLLTWGARDKRGGCTKVTCPACGLMWRPVVPIVVTQTIRPKERLGNPNYVRA